MEIPTISLCLIAKNEEKNIAECINLVKPAVDEVIVVDTGSSDNTVKIAEELGAKVDYFEWNDNFSDARNKALELATKDWILFIDCDERLSAENLALVKATIAKLPEDYMAVQFPIVSITEDGEITSYRILMFKNDPRIRYGGRVHESVASSINAIKGKYVKVDVPVKHLGYANKKDLMAKAVGRNYRILKEEYEKNPENLETKLYLAKTELSIFKNYQNAKKYLDACLHQEAEMTPAIKSEFYFLSGYVSYLLKDEEKAIGYWGKNIEIDPNFPDVYWTCGYYFYEKKQYGTALQFFEQVLRVNPHMANCQIIGFAYKKSMLQELIVECASRSKDFIRALAWQYKFLKEGSDGQKNNN